MNATVQVQGHQLLANVSNNAEILNCVIPGFRHGVNEIFALLGCCTVQIGNQLLANCHSTLCNIPDLILNRNTCKKNVMIDFTLRVGVSWYVMSCSVLSLLSRSSETLVHLYHTARCHVEENSSLCNHGRGNLRSAGQILVLLLLVHVIFHLTCQCSPIIQYRKWSSALCSEIHSKVSADEVFQFNKTYSFSILFCMQTYDVKCILCFFFWVIPGV